MFSLAVAFAGTAAFAQDAEEQARELLIEVERLRGLELSKDLRFAEAKRPELERSWMRGIGRLTRPGTVTILKTLGFVPPRQNVAKRAAQVLWMQGYGRYDAKGRRLLAHPGSKRKNFAKLVLLTRLWTHAIDDNHYKSFTHLEKSATSLDAEFAYECVIEGSAAGMMQQWAVHHKQGRRMDELLDLRKWEDERNRRAFEAQPIYSRKVAHGILGLHFLTEGKGSAALLPDIPVGVGRNVKRGFKTPPKSSEQVLHPEKYWTSVDRDHPVVFADEKAFEAKLTKSVGAKVVDRETLGEFYSAMLGAPLVRKIRPNQWRRLAVRAKFWTNKSGMGWGGDRCWLVDRAGKSGVAWVTLWDTEQDAREFAGSYVKLRGARTKLEHASDARCTVFCYGALKGEAKKILELVKAAKLKKGRRAFDVQGSLSSPR